MRSEIAKEILSRPRPRKMKVSFWGAWQFGLCVSVGKNFERRKYVCFDLPFCSLQILWRLPKN